MLGFSAVTHYHWNDGPNSYYKYDIGIRTGDLYAHNDSNNTSVMGIYAVIGYDVNAYTGSPNWCNR